MKQVKHFLLTVAAILCCISASAYDFKVDGICYNNTSTSLKLTVSVAQGEYSGSVTIPESVTYNGNTYSVESIGYFAFSGCSRLTSVVIGNSVTSIDLLAFSHCSGLTSIEIPNSVTSIGPSAFSHCSGLTSVTIPNSVTSIDDEVFDGCSGLTRINVNCDSIGSWFEGNTSIKEVVIGDSVTNIVERAFDGCSGLTSITVEEANQTYDSRNNCNAIIETETNTLVLGCKSTVIPNSVTSIGERAFYDCDGLTSIEIPNSVESIGDYAFGYCDGLTSVVIGNSVESIGEYAFYLCRGLTSVTIGNSVEIIGNDAFFGCYDLKEVHISDIAAWCGLKFVDEYSKPLYYAHHLFLKGEEVKDLIIPEGVESIGNSAFYNCDGLTSVIISNSVESIGNSAFYNCDGLTSVIIGNSVESIGNSAFYDCDGLTSVTIPNSVKSIGRYAFAYSELKTVNSYAKVPPTIHNDAFGDVKDNATLHVVKGCKNAYASDENWKGFLNIIDDLLIISESILLDKTNISTVAGETVVLTATIYPEDAADKKVVWTSSDSEVASVVEGRVTAHKVGTATITATTTDGSNLTATCKVTVKPTLATSISLDKTSVALKETEIVTLTATVLPETTTNKGVVWASSNSEVASVVEGEVTAHKVGTATITATTTDGSNLTASCRVTVKSTPYFEAVNSDGKTIYYNITSNDNLTVEVTCKGSKYNEYSDEYSGSINIPSSVFFNGKTYSVTSIGASVFRGCRGLTSVTIPNSVESIGEYAFYSCSGLTSVTIGNSVESIGNYAFYGCRGLTSIEIPNSVTSIGVSAFDGCSGLTRVNINCDSIGSWFERNTSIKEVVIGDSVTNIGERAFYNCSGLTSVTIGNSVESIGNYAFYGCRGLTSVTIGNSVTSIGSSAFYNCSGLTSVTIGNSVESIGNSAFRGCSKITDVYCYAEKVPSTESSAFGGSYVEYATLHVPAESIEDYKATEPWSGFYRIVALTGETGIEDIAVEDINFNDAPVYNLQGMKMQDVDNLPKGIYIKGGKKFMVK